MLKLILPVSHHASTIFFTLDMYTNCPKFLGVRNGVPIGPQVIYHFCTSKQIIRIVVSHFSIWWFSQVNNTCV
jgi:hypothetical protein